MEAWEQLQGLGDVGREWMPPRGPRSIFEKALYLQNKRNVKVGLPCTICDEFQGTGVC